MFRLHAIQHDDPLSVNSILADLPVTKARNSYTRLVDGRVTLLDGEDGSPRSYHKFCFRFFPISTEHVNKINCIMLEQSYNISKIVFGSQLGARKTLEYYLSMPCEHNNFKTYLDVPNDPRLVCLKKLEQAVKQLGSNITAKYKMQRLKVNEEEEFEILGQMLAKGLPTEPTESMSLYTKLGDPVTVINAGIVLTIYRWKCHDDA